MVWHSFHPDQVGRELDEEKEVRVSCAELLWVKRKGLRSCEYAFDLRPHSKGGSFADGGRRLAWEMAVGLLWTVDHLVKVDAPLERLPSSSSPSCSSPGLVAASIEKRSFMFDYRRAEMEIRSYEASLRSGEDLAQAQEDDNLAARLAAVDLAGADHQAGEAGEELAAARVSADEAAALRKRLAPARREVSKKSPPTPVGQRRAEVCRYSAQRCEGCNGVF